MMDAVPPDRRGRRSDDVSRADAACRPAGRTSFYCKGRNRVVTGQRGRTAVAEPSVREGVAMRRRCGLAGVAVALAPCAGSVLWAVDWDRSRPGRAPSVAAPTPNSPDEPLATSFSLARSAAFLDAVALDWTRKRQCGTCHTNYAYLIARPALKDGRLAARWPRSARSSRTGSRTGTTPRRRPSRVGRRGRGDGRGPGAQRRGDDRQAPPADPPGPRPDLDAPEARRLLGLAQVRLAPLRARRLLRRRLRRARRRPRPRRLRPDRRRPRRASTGSRPTSGRRPPPTCTTRRSCSGPRPGSTA